MVNWSKFKLATLLLICLCSFTAATVANWWGFYGHKRINRMACLTLPPSLFGFYKKNIEYLTEHAVDPDKRRYAIEGEAQCHFIDLDHYLDVSKGDKINEIMPTRWLDAVAKFSEDTLQAYGIVPWHILLVQAKLQKAFEVKNVDLILKYSADLGHYIGDAHVPLHTTKNYNGQLTNQKGIHGLWESRLVEMKAEEYDYFIGKAEYIEDLHDFIWKVIAESHFAVDSVLQLEKVLSATFPPDQKYSYERRGNTQVRTYSQAFSETYHHALNGMVERRLRASIHAVGSFWFTAWVNAGQPDLTALVYENPSASLIEELKQLDKAYLSNIHKGRICE